VKPAILGKLDAELTADARQHAMALKIQGRLRIRNAKYEVEVLKNPEPEPVSEPYFEGGRDSSPNRWPSQPFPILSPLTGKLATSSNDIAISSSPKFGISPKFQGGNSPSKRPSPIEMPEAVPSPAKAGQGGSPHFASPKFSSPAQHAVPHQSEKAWRNSPTKTASPIHSSPTKHGQQGTAGRSPEYSYDLNSSGYDVSIPKASNNHLGAGQNPSSSPQFLHQENSPVPSPEVWKEKFPKLKGQSPATSPAGGWTQNKPIVGSPQRWKEQDGWTQNKDIVASPERWKEQSPKWKGESPGKLPGAWNKEQSPEKWKVEPPGKWNDAGSTPDNTRNETWEGKSPEKWNAAQSPKKWQVASSGTEQSPRKWKTGQTPEKWAGAGQSPAKWNEPSPGASPAKWNEPAPKKTNDDAPASNLGWYMMNPICSS
jgi:hypothetical protein